MEFILVPVAIAGALLAGLYVLGIVLGIALAGAKFGYYNCFPKIVLKLKDNAEKRRIEKERERKFWINIEKKTKKGGEK